jgi:hypothetical protein
MPNPHRARGKLRARGATVRTEILSWNLPHAFLAFAAAQRVACTVSFKLIVGGVARFSIAKGRVVSICSRMASMLGPSRMK